MFKRTPRYNYLVCIYLAGMLLFSMFRLGEVVAYCMSAEGEVAFDGLFGRMMLMGMRFDTVVSCYILALPLVMMIVGEMARIRKRWYYAVAHYYTMVLYTIAFFACAADIPYFCYFFNRLDVVALSWAEDFGTSMGMIFGEPRYWLYLIVFIAVTSGWWWTGRLFYRRVLVPEEHLSYGWGIPVAAVLLALWFFGQRGTVTGGRPVRVSTAYFSANPFINQMGLNPVFTFLKSLQASGKEANQEIKLTDLETARAAYAEERSRECTLIGDRLEKGTNVIVVLMESMSADKTCLGPGGPEASLTPCLDSLMELSLTSTEAYSAGIHTYNGIYSTLYGQPALMARHSMRQTPLPRVYGLPQALAEAGYSTTFFVAHNADFDNLLGFLTLNGMQRVVEKKDYPEEEYVNTWGPPDHVLFDHVLEHCDSMATKGPFFASVMTITDHGPYVIPKGIDHRFKHKEIEKQVVEYADWAIGRFMRMAAQRPWFDKTLFVFVADHGAAMDKTYDMPLSYNHVPLLFYAPERRIAPAFSGGVELQIDIAPTILGWLGLDGADRMLGLDGTRYTRPYAYFCADDKIGVVDGEWFYIYRVKQDGRESLFRYKEQDTHDYIDEQPEQAAKMRRYGLGMIQMGQEELRIEN